MDWALKRVSFCFLLVKLKNTFLDEKVFYIRRKALKKYLQFDPIDRSVLLAPNFNRMRVELKLEFQKYFQLNRTIGVDAANDEDSVVPTNFASLGCDPTVRFEFHPKDTIASSPNSKLILRVVKTGKEVNTTCYVFYRIGVETIGN